MLYRSGRDAATSPVIGTILLVAITVVLVAVIAAVVMGFGNSDGNKSVGVNVKPALGADAQVILYGGESLTDLVRLEMIDQDSPDGKYIEFWNSSSGVAPIVGYPYPVTGVAKVPDEKNMSHYDTRVNVKGIFADGTETILLVQPMQFTAKGRSDLLEEGILEIIPVITNAGIIAQLYVKYVARDDGTVDIHFYFSGRRSPLKDFYVVSPDGTAELVPGINGGQAVHPETGYKINWVPFPPGGAVRFTIVGIGGGTYEVPIPSSSGYSW